MLLIQAMATPSKQLRLGEKPGDANGKDKSEEALTDFSSFKFERVLSENTDRQAKLSTGFPSKATRFFFFFFCYLEG